MFQMQKVEVVFKFIHFFFTSGLFIYYIYNERYPALCLQALTYQVRFHISVNEKKVFLKEKYIQGLLFLSLYSFVTVLDIFNNRVAGMLKKII